MEGQDAAIHESTSHARNRPVLRGPARTEHPRRRVRRARRSAIASACAAFDAADAREIDAYVIHPSSVPVSREHRRAKTDRLDTELLKRAFLGWLRVEPKHCSMAAIPTIEDEDAAA